MAEELFRSADLLVRAALVEGCDRCVVTFDHHGSGADLDAPGFGERFFADCGLSVVVVRGRGNHWYQYADMAPAMAAVRERLAGHARIMTYGSSMGGYAALRFADAVGANACLALSPQYTNNPATTPWEDRWFQDATTIVWREEIDAVLRCGCVPVVAYDPAGPDQRQVELIAAATPIAAVPIAYAGHPVGTYLAAAGLLDELVRATLAGTLDAPAFAALAWQRRRGNRVWFAELARRQPAHRPRTGVALARRALAAEPDSALLIHTLASRLTAAGDHDEALALHADAVKRSGGFFPFASGYCDALIEADDRPAALARARELVTQHGDHAHAHSQLAHALWRNRRFDEALASAERAAAMVPANVHYAEVVALYRHRRRRSTRLAKLLRRLFGLLPTAGKPPPTGRR